MTDMISGADRRVVMEKNVLGAMILEQEKMLENAQHRIVVELCRSRLDLMRHIDQRLTVDRAMICAIPSVAVVQALSDVFRDYEERLQNIFREMDKDTEQLVAAYADKEEFETAYQKIVQRAELEKRKWFGQRKAAALFEEAAKAAAANVEACERILALRKRLLIHENGLRQGQKKILSLIEEFIERYQERDKSVSEVA
ncbi:hypothetical protein ACSSZE_10520 [Acidithiobacillus caldus]